MKVLIISTDRKIFEENSAVRNRMIEYRALAEELHIIVFSRKALGFSSKRVADNVWLYPTESRSKWGYIFDAIRIGKKIVSKKDSWLVTAQDPFETGLAGWRIAKARGAKLQFQVHTDLFSPYFSDLQRTDLYNICKGRSFADIVNIVRARIAKSLLPKADCVRVVSERIKKSLRTNGVRLKAEPEALPVFVDVQAIRNTPIDVDLHKLYPQFETIILMVSRLEKEKNIPLALSVFKHTLEKFPKTGLVIVGDGSLLPVFKKRERDLGLSENVIFEGGNSDVISFYKTADIFLHTSNYEGYGLVLVEAAAADCPIVTTDVGIASDYFTDTQSAHICPVGDEQCLADRLMKSIEHKESRGMFALKAQNALEEHLREKTKEAYLAAYKKAWERCTR